MCVCVCVFICALLLLLLLTHCPILLSRIQGDVMIRGNQVPNDLSILLDPDHLEGFGYATGVGFDPHHIPRGR